MVLHRRIADSTIVSNRTKFRQRAMESSTSVSRRWTSRVVENINGLPGTRLPTSTEPTTHQKVRRLLEEQAWKSQSSERNNYKTSTNNLLKNYNIVASRGELTRGTFSIRENSVDRINLKSGKNFICDNSLVNGRDESGRIFRERKTNNWERRRDNERSITKLKSIGGLSKSSSVPTNLKEGLEVGPPANKHNDGILKRSSAFIERLTGEKKEFKTPGIKRGSQLTPEKFEFGRNLKKSPRFKSLNPRSDSKSGVKKSVSFSTDTSFESQRGILGKAVVHEVKAYRKGVLQDLNEVETLKKPEDTQEQAMSLLRAAREADELALNDLVSRIRRLGLGKIDVNATDSSGRSVISYMAGNGAADLLGTILTFPGANPNLPDNEGNTPLHFAAQAGQAECLNILLQRCTGIELDARNVLGFTPLMKAAIQGRTKCAKILLFAGANPTLRDHGRGLRADQWAKFCGRYVCSDVIERFSRHRIMDRNSSSCRWGSEPELAAKVLQGKVIPVQQQQQQQNSVASSGLKSRIKRVFRTTTGHDKSFSLVSQLTSAALCASTPALPKPGDIPAVKNLLRPLSVPQLRITLAAPTEVLDKCDTSFTEKIENTIIKPPRSKKKTK